MEYGDLISRQEAIDALGEKPLAWTEGEYELGLQRQWESDVEAIKALPSAQEKQRGLVGWRCPVCGRGLSPFESVCPCNNGKGWEITC